MSADVRVSDEPVSPVPADAVHPEILRQRLRHRLIAASILVAVLLALIAAVVMLGPGSADASGGCGGG